MQQQALDSIVQKQALEIKPICVAMFRRSEEIITRDHDICVAKNRAIYYAPIPELSPDAPDVMPLGLVTAKAFPKITTHAIWTPNMAEAWDPTAKPKVPPSSVSMSACHCIIS